MSRDPRSEARDADAAGQDARDGTTAEPERPEAALLTAYVDGVAELAPDERQPIEALLADDPDARADAAAVRTLLERLRALPPGGDGDEPDWAAMERSIRQAVAAEAPRPWWRSWRWLVPAMTFATAAAVLIALWPPSGSQSRSITTAPPDHTAQPERPSQDAARAAPSGDGMVALWLDGDEVDVPSDVASDVIGDVVPVQEALARTGEPDEVGLLPATDLAWVDNLDAAALERAESWLAGKKKG